MKKTRGLVLALLASGALVGCGGDDSNEALTYDGFIEAANGVCTAAETAVDAAAEGFSGDPANDVELYDELIPALEDATNGFGELNPPEELQEPYDDFVEATDAQLQGARDAQEAAEAGDEAEYQRILEDVGSFDKQADEAGSKLGAADCVG